MTTGYEFQGITHGSASMLNQSIDSIATFVAQRLFGYRFPFGAAPKRGLAVEAGVVAVLARGAKLSVATDHAVRQFDDETRLNTHEPVEKRDAEREHIAPMIELALEALADYGEAVVPAAGQEQVTLVCKTDEWSLPIIGYLDMRFPAVDKIVDLKTTLRMPSEMSAAHQRQRAIYAKATGDAVEFLYVTPKKTAFKADGDVDAIMAEIKTHFIRLEALLRLDPEMIRQIIPVQPESFYWKGAEHIRKELFDL